MTDSFTIRDTSAGALVFIQPDAGGILYCNAEPCAAAGQLAGPFPFRVGHRTLKAAAQKWYLDRVPLIKAYAAQTGQPWPFMKKEAYDATSEPAAAQGNGSSGKREVDARHPKESRPRVSKGRQGRKTAKAKK